MPTISKSEALDFAEIVHKLVDALVNEGFSRMEAIMIVTNMLAPRN